MLNIDHEKIIYSIKDTMRSLEDGVVQKLVIYDDLDSLRVVMKKKSDEEGEEPIIKFMSPSQFEDPNALIDSETKEEYD